MRRVDGCVRSGCDVHVAKCRSLGCAVVELGQRSAAPTDETDAVSSGRRRSRAITHTLLPHSSHLAADTFLTCTNHTSTARAQCMRSQWGRPLFPRFSIGQSRGPQQPTRQTGLTKLMPAWQCSVRLVQCLSTRLWFGLAMKRTQRGGGRCGRRAAVWFQLVRGGAASGGAAMRSPLVAASSSSY